MSNQFLCSNGSAAIRFVERLGLVDFQQAISSALLAGLDDRAAQPIERAGGWLGDAAGRLQRDDSRYT